MCVGGHYKNLTVCLLWPKYSWYHDVILISSKKLHQVIRWLLFTYLSLTSTNPYSFVSASVLKSNYLHYFVQSTICHEVGLLACR